MGYHDTQVRTVDSPSTQNKIKNDKVRKAITEFQSFMKLDVTGELDKSTISTMLSPRCGVKDKNTQNLGIKIHRNPAARSRRRRFVAEGTSWSATLLYYYITTYSTQFSQSAQLTVIQEAFRTWAEVSPLRFREATKSTDAHILISFQTGMYVPLLKFQ